MTKAISEQEHKPSNVVERKRIEKDGGTLAKKAGVQRVVWNRPKLNNPRKDFTEGDSVEYEQVPFLAVTRSLGDLWSYDRNQDVYHISPEPDVQCISLDTLEHRCIILGSDGLWNVVSKQAAIELIRICERETERRVFLDPNVDSNFFYNPAASLVKYSLCQWKRIGVRADNVSALVVMIDPPGPSMTKRREDRRKSNFSALEILSSLSSETPSNENFSKQLTTEFLIECNRWRSANELKSETEQRKLGDCNSKLVQEKENEGNDSYCLSTSGIVHKSHDKKVVNMSNDVTVADNRPQLRYDSHNSITSDPFYAQICMPWIKNDKIWTFVLSFFHTKGLSSGADIIHFLNSMDPGLSGEILRLMPWIFMLKNTFKSGSQLQLSLSNISLFSDFWIELYVKHIRPLEKTSLLMQMTSMKAIIKLLKPYIRGLLKQHNYLIALPKSENPFMRYLNGENDKKNENFIKSLQNKYGLLDSFNRNRKLENLSKIVARKPIVRCYSNPKDRISKMSRFDQSDRKTMHSVISFNLKRSVSEKQLTGTQELSKCHGLPLTDSILKLKQTERSLTGKFKRRYSITNSKGEGGHQDASNCNAAYRQEEYNNKMFIKRRHPNNQINLKGKLLRSVSALPGHRFASGNRKN